MKHSSEPPPNRGLRRDHLIDSISEKVEAQHRDHHNAAEAVYMTLREAILRGVLHAGQPLGEIQLAETFGRSRTPVHDQ